MRERFVIGLLRGSENEVYGCCTGCGCPVTSEAVRERIVDLMLQGIRDDMRKAVARLEHDEPEKYGRLAAMTAQKNGCHISRI